jgi:hypothetical protein
MMTTLPLVGMSDQTIFVIHSAVSKADANFTRGLDDARSPLENWEKK